MTPRSGSCALPHHRVRRSLLTAVEGFTPDETAQILGISFDQIATLISDAQREIDAELATDVLIIEDESIIAADIEALVKELGHHVIGIAATRAEAIDAIKDTKPGLVLADIQLADGSSGIDAVKDILATLDVPVIFITAFPERLSDRGKTRAYVLDHKTVPTRDCKSFDRPSLILSSRPKGTRRLKWARAPG